PSGIGGDGVDPSRDPIQMSQIVFREADSVHCATVLREQVVYGAAYALRVAGDDRGFAIEPGYRQAHEQAYITEGNTAVRSSPGAITGPAHRSRSPPTACRSKLRCS
ncbi:MAG TPA: hypothetical protein VMR74_14075, partial [Gammaproteobacteria bacterium]|nr:hypothetical protein [Gammaproteobacteria bacterium]